MRHKLQNKLFLFAALAVLTCVVSPIGQAQGDAASVAGKWHFVLDTEGGAREVEADFHVDGDKVTGTWGAQEAKGTFSEGKLLLEFAFNSDEAGPGTMKIEGKLNGDAMTGNWAFQSYDGTFKATRTKPAAQ